MSKLYRIMLSLLLCVNIALSVLPAAFASPQEAEGVTVTVSTPEELMQLAEDCRLDSYSVGLTVLLEADIDLSGVEFDGIPSFSGILDGGGHRISGLEISSGGSVKGFIRYLRPDAQVRDLCLEGVVAPGGSHRRVGGIAGSNAGLISRCTFSGEVTGADSVGGLAGLNELTGIIEDCAVSGTIHGGHAVGGAAGENRGVIRRTANKAAVNATAEQNTVELEDITLESLSGTESPGTSTDMGGIAGVSIGVIRDCTNNGTVGYPHIGYNVGGIAGRQMGYITGCSNYGAIHGRKEAGGIVGQMEPSVMVKYDRDTLQVLHGQLAGMSAMINSTAGAAQSGFGQLSNQAGQLQDDIDSAMNAVGQLTPDGEGALPDPDSANAAINNLNSALSNMNGTISGMGSSGADAVGELTEKLGELIDGINSISSTISNASQGLGGTVTDISDADTDADTTGKVEGCLNIGEVSADLNAGGIVGAMSVENDLDPESDFTAVGSSSLKFSCEGRAVVLRCENKGTVTARRQNAGGVAGYMMLGLVSRSGNTGKVDAPAAEYVGGVAGLSMGYIRSSWSKSVLSGKSCIGGVAGRSDNTVTDCLAVTGVESGTEKIGGILGYAEKLSSLKNEGFIAGNYYLAAGNDIGGADGICYQGAAESMSQAEFYALPELPEAFRRVTITFLFAGGDRKLVTLSSGAELTDEMIPALPEREGCSGRWDGLEKLNRASVDFDAVLTASYEALTSTLESSETAENGRPLLLAIGSFEDDARLQTQPLSSDPLPESDGEYLMGREYSVSGEGAPTDMRLYLSEDYHSRTEQLQLYLRSTDGSWREGECTLNGSYLAFSTLRGDEAVCVRLLPESYLAEIIAVGSSLLLVLAGIIVSAARKRSRRAENITEE